MNSWVKLKEGIFGFRSKLNQFFLFYLLNAELMQYNYNTKTQIGQIMADAL